MGLVQEIRGGGGKGFRSSLQDSLAPATGGHNTGVGVVKRGGRGLRRSEEILGSASRQCGLAVCILGLSSPLRTAPVDHHKWHI